MTVCIFCSNKANTINKWMFNVFMDQKEKFFIFALQTLSIFLNGETLFSIYTFGAWIFEFSSLRNEAFKYFFIFFLFLWVAKVSSMNFVQPEPHRIHIEIFRTVFSFLCILKSQSVFDLANIPAWENVLWILFLFAVTIINKFRTEWRQ